MDWQPISTAPENEEVMVWWQPPNGPPRPGFDKFSTDIQEWWRMGCQMPDGGDWLGTGLDGGPLYWAPMPEAPALGK